MSAEPNPAYSAQLPSLRLIWSANSLSEAKTCWRYFKYRQEGWTQLEDNIDIDFGTFFHNAQETFEHAKAGGAGHGDALDAAIDRALTDTWNPALDRPWASDNPRKNRANLIRSIVWYREQFKDDSLKTVILANGKPAVELIFSLDIGLKSRLTGEPFLIRGRIDKVVLFNGSTWIHDFKTTKSTVNQAYFARYSPNNQVSCYSWSGTIMLSAGAANASYVAGVIIDATQVAKNFSRTQRGFIPRSPAQLDEWMGGVYRLLEEYETNVERDEWPMNEEACGVPRLDEKTGEIRYGCPFRAVCSSDPSIRPKLLELNFKKRI